MSAACICAGGLSACSAEDDAQEKQDPNAGLKTVSTSKLTEVAKTVRANAPGRIVSLNDTLISSELMARVEKVHHQRGDNVGKGAALIDLDCRLYRYRRNSAKTRLDIALSEREVQTKDFKRQRKLYDQGLISEEVFLARENAAERSKGNARVAESDLNIAGRDVSNCTVRAPFDATVMDVYVAVGELLQPGARMTRIVDISSIEVWADLNPRYARELAVGDEAAFVQNGIEIPISLISKSAVPDLASGNYKTRFRIAAANPGLSGSGEVFWQTRERFLDGNYLRKYQDRYGIMTAKNGRAHFLPIDDAREGWFVPTGGLNEDLSVIVWGREKVDDGDALNIEVDAAPESSGAGSEEAGGNKKTSETGVNAR